MDSKIPTKEVAQEMDRLHRGLVERGVIRSCINCEYWVEKDGGIICEHAGSTPPPETVVFGCPSWYWKDEDIPF